MRREMTWVIMAGLVTLWVNAVAGAGTGERLDRGLVAVPLADNGVYLGWRLLESDSPKLGFDVYRSVGDGKGVKVNKKPVTKTTDFIDTSSPADQDRTYWVEPISKRTKKETPKKFTVKASAPTLSYVSIKLNGDYAFQKAGIADLDGDGSYDFVIKQPSANVDPYEKFWKPSPGTYSLEAYLHDGTFLWRKDLGWSIEQGIWYSPYLVYDFDGDGKAEVAVKTGEGDPRDKDGRVQGGPEYLSVLDGMTGEEITRVPWHPRMENYNVTSRNQLGVAFLDGKTPHVLMPRGTYGQMRLTAFRYAKGHLETVWEWTNVDEPKTYWGQGAHFMHSGDLDGDKRDEVLLGSCVIDDNGKSLWSTGLGHPDHFYFGEIDPAHPGLEIYYGIEKSNPKNSVCLTDAKTGTILWGIDQASKHVHDGGLCSDIDARYPGLECYSGEKETPKDKPYRWLHSASGQLLAREDTCDIGLSPRSAYWDADLEREIVTGSGIYKFETKEKCFLSLEGGQVVWADVLGDWREEIITSVPGELRIYTTTVPASDRRPCLMQDPIYRHDVAHTAMGYAEPPMLSYWVGEKKK